MSKSNIFLLFFLYIFNVPAFSAIDSLGIETRNGKTFILHEVEPKETFFAISQRYKVTIDEIVAQNPDTKEGLKIDQVILIPYNGQSKTVAEKGNKTIHTVKASETLFSISQAYDVTIDDLKKWNALTNNALDLGQELIINKNGTEINEKPVLEEATEESQVVAYEQTPGTAPVDGMVTHTVEHSQTLFSIAKIYDVKVEDLQKWNNLADNTLSPGQKLIVKKKQVSDMGAEIKEEKADAFLAGEKPVQKEEFEPYEDSTTKTSIATEDKQQQKEKPAQVEGESSSGFSKRVELGLAEVIEGASDSKKFRALHRSAPVGTIIQVRNEMNNLSVFVRVLGTLPDTGENDKVLIKISRSAYERLGAVNNRFPVEISYVP